MSFSPLAHPAETAGADAQPPLRETPIAMALQAAMAKQGRPDDPAPQQLAADPPLRLSQMILKPAAGAREPRWMTVPDQPTRLRSSRELSSPISGAADASIDQRPRPDGDAVPSAATGLTGGDADAATSPSAGTPLLAGSAPAAGSAPSTRSAGILGWEIPPIRWGGSLGYSLQKSTSNTGHSSSSQGLFANMNAASYIYAPWFARVSGRLGMTTSSSSSASSGSVDNGESKTANVVGGGEVNMFSSSRFPFRAYFDRSDSRASGNFVSNAYVSDRLGLSQSFRADDGMSGGNFLLDRSAVSTSDGKRDNVTAISGSYSQQTGIVQHNLNARYSLGQRSGSGEQARLLGFNTAHNANVSDTINLGATVNYSDSDIRTENSSGSTFSSRGRFLQLYTFGSWLPEFEDLEDLPLTLSGSLRYTTQETQFGADGFKAQTIGGNLSGTYRFSQNLTASANGAMNQITLSNGAAQLLTQLGSSVNYVGNPLTFGNFSYNWNTGANANWQGSVADTPATSSLGGQASHSLSRMYLPEPGHSVSLTATQSLSVNQSQMIGSSESLNHSVSANYGLSAGERFSGSLNAMVSDVRTSGYNEQHYQTLNVGLYGQGQLSQVSTANINLMFNWSDQTFQSVDAFGFPTTQNDQTMTLNGSAAYSHLRFAGVRGLRYNLIFAADTRLRDERLFGNVNGDVDRARFSLTNRLEYTIGLLDFRLSLVHNDVGGKKNALVFFQVSRQIGSY